MSKLKLVNLSKTYHLGNEEIRILDNISFDFPEQGSFAILGRSGVGKSTLLHLIAGIDQADSGSVFLDGRDIQRLPDDRRSLVRLAKIGFIFQFHHLLPEFTALENVAMPLWAAGIEEQESEARAKECLVRVGLGDRLAHRPGELSGGEQQRVAISRALVAEPSLILADEPTGNLDERTAKQVRQLLLAEVKRLNALLIVVTHSQELAQSLDIQREMLAGGCFS
jgi:lipoprotein-releasing system ATP-binding protein